MPAAKKAKSKEKMLMDTIDQCIGMFEQTIKDTTKQIQDIKALRSEITSAQRAIRQLNAVKKKLAKP